jgi:hypothetical protein
LSFVAVVAHGALGVLANFFNGRLDNWHISKRYWAKNALLL